MKHLFFIIFSIFMLVLGIRGIPGNPNHQTMNETYWTDDGPLELSPERGRFALLYSILEDKSAFFSVPVARLALPDLGYHNGNYVSLFAPGLSFISMPGYSIGKLFGASQIGTFGTIAFFGLINSLLVIQIALLLGAKKYASYLSGIIFLFATPAFAYAVTLYQHHITTFLLLGSIYLLLRYKGILPLIGIWFLIAISIPLDYPNLMILLPVGVMAAFRMIWAKEDEAAWTVSLDTRGLLTLVGVLPPLLFFLLFNRISYGNPFQLSGTVASVKAIDAQGNPASLPSYIDPQVNQPDQPQQKKSVINFFQPRNLINGLFVHFFSLDRGILIFTPVILLSIAGFAILYKSAPQISALFSAICGFTILLYAMWGDPWGGWAFGSRYLIPVYAICAIALAIALSAWRRKIIFLIVFGIALWYSLAVNTLGALTSNRNPPSKETQALSTVSGRREELSYDRNINMLKANKSKSFVYQTIASTYMNAQSYYFLLTGLLFLCSLTYITLLYKHEKN